LRHLLCQILFFYGLKCIFTLHSKLLSLFLDALLFRSQKLLALLQVVQAHSHLLGHELLLLPHGTSLEFFLLFFDVLHAESVQLLAHLNVVDRVLVEALDAFVLQLLLELPDLQLLLAVELISLLVDQVELFKALLVLFLQLKLLVVYFLPLLVFVFLSLYEVLLPLLLLGWSHVRLLHALLLVKVDALLEALRLHCRLLLLQLAPHYRVLHLRLELMQLLLYVVLLHRLLDRAHVRLLQLRYAVLLQRIPLMRRLLRNHIRCCSLLRSAFHLLNVLVE